MSLERVLAGIAAEFSPVALASSLSAEDMVLTDAIARADLPIEVFVLNTGRLHGDTLDLIGRLRSHYGLPVKVYAPDPEAVAQYARRHGRDAFYRDHELRQRCCEIRKVEPLRRALQGKRAWITGQRREQSALRRALPAAEHDAVHGLEKFNPLADWTEAMVWAYIASRGVPSNRLYEQGYRSIGCAPCTRPVLPGEDLRSGRWWWESADRKECGLHIKNGVRPLALANDHPVKEGV
ncbi:MAG TPA: phosphoadenylyl-sulfate reductase [Burkholderiales bacterium]